MAQNSNISTPYPKLMTPFMNTQFRLETSVTEKNIFQKSVCLTLTFFFLAKFSKTICFFCLLFTKVFTGGWEQVSSIVFS